MRVLVVDDVKIIADTLAEILRENGFEAFVAYNGESAIGAAIELDPELLISDVLMDGVNGVEAAIRIRMLLPECKVILCSGQPDFVQTLHQERIKEHSFEILPKPILPHDLLARINSLVQLGRQSQESGGPSGRPN